MLSTICRQLSGQSVALWLYDELTESIFLRLVANSTGPLDFDRNRLLTQSPPSWGKNSGFQELLSDACPILCEDTATDPRVNSEMRDYFFVTDTKKFLAVPILAEGHVRGMITVCHAERAPYRNRGGRTSPGARPSGNVGHPAHRSRRAEPASRHFGRTK
jgi:GAF domain-containing protein